MAVMESTGPATDNDRETVTRSGERAIKNWIDSQMRGRGRTVVSVGSHTAMRIPATSDGSGSRVSAHVFPGTEARDLSSFLMPGGWQMASPVRA